MPSSETHVPEPKVLRRKEATLVDENEWPQLDVRNVQIRDSKGALTSLFAATLENPLTLTGELETKSNPQRVLPPYRTKSYVPMIVRDVAYYAFGTYTNGEYAIWAASEAGWLSIAPAKAYQKVYDQMTDALGMLYYLVDVYEHGKKMSSEDLFKKYGQENGLSAKEAAQKFYLHAPFLATRMAKGDEGIKWGHTSFYQHLRKVHPEAFGIRAAASAAKAAQTQPTTAKSKSAATQAKTAAPQPASVSVRPKRAAAVAAAIATPSTLHEPPRAASTRSQARDSSSRTHSTDARVKRKTRASEAAAAQQAPGRAAQSPGKRTDRPRKASQGNDPQPPLLSTLNKTKAREVWKFMQKKSNDALPDISEMTIATFAHYLHEQYEFADEIEAEYFLNYLAPELVGMMSINRNRSYDPWTELPVYDELMEAKVPSRVKGRVAAIQLHKRNNPLPGVPDDTEASDQDSSEESVFDKAEATVRKREASRRRISMMRPKSASKYSRKAAKRAGKGKQSATERDEDDQDEEMLDADAGADPENESISAERSPKRKSMSDDGDDDDDEDEDDEDEEPEYPNKRFTRSRGDVDPELEDLEFAVQQARSTRLPVRGKPSISTANGQNSSQRPGLVSEPLISTDANAPGDIWNCPHMGCMHKVYGASELDSKELIREHMLDHKDKGRVDLVRDEEEMTRLPVNHLLKRIREMAERTGGEQLMQLEGGLVGLFPPPLQRSIY